MNLLVIKKGKIELACLHFFDLLLVKRRIINHILENVFCFCFYFLFFISSYHVHFLLASLLYEKFKPSFDHHLHKYLAKV